MPMYFCAFLMSLCRLGMEGARGEVYLLVHFSNVTVARGRIGDGRLSFFCFSPLPLCPRGEDG